MGRQKGKTNSKKVKSPVKKKSKFKKGRSSRENDKRKRFMGDKLGENEKEKFKNDEKKKEEGNA